MASFTVKPEAQLPVNYTGASQGISASPNTALGTLFEGLASALDSGIKEADRSTQESIRNDIFDNVDSIQAEFGVDSATDFQADQEAPTTPHALNDAGRHLSGLQAQYERGGLRESHYWARMNSMVRQLRGKYPGYRAEIDSMVSGIVGARPANALRSALFNEWEDAARDANASADAYGKLVDWAVKQPASATGRSYLPADYFARQENGNPVTMTELQAHIAQVQVEEGRITAERTAMALDSERSTINTRRANENFRVEATSVVNGLLSDTTSSLGATYQELQQQLQNAQTAAGQGNPLDADMVNSMRAGFAELTAGVQTALNQRFTESWDGNPKNSYAALLTPEEKNAVMASAMQPIQILQDSLLNEDYGAANAVTAWLQAQSTESQRVLLERIPVMGTLQALKEVAGPDVMGLYLGINPEVQDALGQVLLNHYRAEAGIGTGSITTAVDEGEKSGQTKAYYDGLIRGWQSTVEQVTKGELPLELVQNNVQFMFGRDALQVMSRMTPESRYEYFKKVSSPQVTAQMKKLRDMGDVDSWNTYQSWTTSTFISLFQSAVKSIPATGFSDAGVNVTWDPTTNGFKVSGDVTRNRSSNAMPFGLPNPGASFETNLSTNQVTAGLADLNAAIRTIAPILEINGANTGEEIFELLRQMGYDPAKPSQPNMLQQADKFLGDALVRGLKGVGAIGSTTGTAFESGEL